MMPSVDDRVASLEWHFAKLNNYSVGISGTIMSRVLMENQLCIAYDIEPTGREDTLVFSIGFGAMHQPKVFFYGKLIEHALIKAENYIEETYESDEKILNADILKSLVLKGKD